MKKYRVYGTTTVTVTKEVWANNEDEAYDKAYDELPELNEYCGNGGEDKLIGVEEIEESVSVDDDIHYDDIELLEDDPDFFLCPNCGERCERKEDADGEEYWWCEDCYSAFDEDGNEYEFDKEDEEE